MFYDQIEKLEQTKCTFFFSKEQHEKGKNGRIDKENFTALMKENLQLLKADGFYLCGPEEMIKNVKDVLTFFGVSKSKIHFELFFAPIQTTEDQQTQSTFTGVSKVQVILDSETTHFDLDAHGKTILEMTETAGLDAPFSCRGGVCSTCKAKVLKGSATMTLNYSLTDKEVSEGYILTCQAHPTSDELIVSFDE
jgi:ring-1,2-phenylacetyl-CoA epoxidase subunit PaaE